MFELSVDVEIFSVEVDSEEVETVWSEVVDDVVDSVVDAVEEDSELFELSVDVEIFCVEVDEEELSVGVGDTTGATSMTVVSGAGAGATASSAVANIFDIAFPIA